MYRAQGKSLVGLVAFLCWFSQAKGVLAGNPDPVNWPPEVDAVRAAPDNHTILYESDDIRVLRVNVAPGERENAHHHRWPSVMVVDSLCKFVDYDQDGKEIKFPLPEKPELPLVLRLPPQPVHSVHNVGQTPCSAIRVEFKKPQMPPS